MKNIMLATAAFNLGGIFNSDIFKIGNENFNSLRAQNGGYKRKINRNRKKKLSRRTKNKFRGTK